jgi:hypothetical protein
MMAGMNEDDVPVSGDELPEGAQETAEQSLHAAAELQRSVQALGPQIEILRAFHRDAERAAALVPKINLGPAAQIIGKHKLQLKLLAPQISAIRRQQESLRVLDNNLTSAIKAIRESQAASAPLESKIHQILADFTTAVQLRNKIVDIGPGLKLFQQGIAVAVPLLPRLLDLDFARAWRMPGWEAVASLDIDTAMIIMNEGIPLVWIPRPSVITALLEAPDAEARDDILAAAGADIADDCLAVLGQVGAPHLKPMAGLAISAAEALRADHGAAAQALAANVFDTWLRDAARRGVAFTRPAPRSSVYKHVSGQITPISEEILLSEFEAVCVLAPALPALASFDPADPPPPRFARHPTAHRAGPEQYTPANAVIAVMLAASVLREAEAAGW